MDPEAPEREVDHALDRTHAIADPRCRLRHRVEVGRRCGPERVPTVVEQHAVQPVARVPRSGRDSGRRALGRGEQPLVRDHELAEAPEILGAAHHERRIDAHAHALDALPCARAVDRQRQGHGARATARGTAHERADPGELGEPEELAHLADRAHRVSDRDVSGEVRCEPEQTLGGQRARVDLAVLLLHEQAAESVGVRAKVADHDALDRDTRAADERARDARALDRVDRCGRRAAIG
jgi:hypothetical protein